MSQELPDGYWCSCVVSWTRQQWYTSERAANYKAKNTALIDFHVSIFTSARAFVSVPFSVLQAGTHQMHSKQSKYGDMKVNQSSVLGLVVGNAQCTMADKINKSCSGVCSCLCLILRLDVLWATSRVKVVLCGVMDKTAMVYICKSISYCALQRSSSRTHQMHSKQWKYGDIKANQSTILCL